MTRRDFYRYGTLVLGGLVGWRSPSRASPSCLALPEEGKPGRMRTPSRR